MAPPKIFGTCDPFFEPGPLMGRKVANANFMRALLARDAFDEYHFYLPDESAASHLRSVLAGERPDLAASGRARVMHRLELAERLGALDYHCFHQSDCINLPPHVARLRNMAGRNIFPVTSVTHSLSRADYPLSFLQHLWPGTTPRDAIVCTSKAAVSAVEAYFAALRLGYGLDEALFPAPKLARIPLGVDAEAMRPPSPERRAELRAAMGLSGDETMALCLGRLEHHSKMDLLPLLRAFQRLLAGGLDRNSVRLVLAGWANEGDAFPETISQMAANIGLRCEIRLRPSDAERDELMSVADVFVSVPDNPQETFGLTMLEAGAFGLPVVASDYDGYRDLIVHGETGLLVRTTGPRATPELDALSRLFFDNQYLLPLAQRTAVDVASLAEALGRLMTDAELRGRMGEAARKRVARDYSWQAVVEAHLDLWEDLWSGEVDAARLAALRHPAHPDLAGLFKAYPTGSLEDDARLVWSRAGEALYRGREHPVIYAGVSHLVDDSLLRKLLFSARRPAAVAGIKESLADDAGAEKIEFLILWALKHDYLEYA